MSKGDQLASGGVRASFEPPKVTQEKWNDAFGEEPIRRTRNLPPNYELPIPEVVSTPEKPCVKFRAVQDRIIVRRVEEETKTDGGLYVPDENREKPAEGIVIAVGPGKYVDGELQHVNIQVGERVVFGKFSGAEVKLGVEQYLVLREEDIFLVKEN